MGNAIVDVKGTIELNLVSRGKWGPNNKRGAKKGVRERFSFSETLPSSLQLCNLPREILKDFLYGLLSRYIFFALPTMFSRAGGHQMTSLTVEDTDTALRVFRSNALSYASHYYFTIPFSFLLLLLQQYNPGLLSLKVTWALFTTFPSFSLSLPFFPVTLLLSTGFFSFTFFTFYLIFPHLVRFI